MLFLLPQVRRIFLEVFHLKIENIPAKNINENIFTYSLTPYG